MDKPLQTLHKALREQNYDVPESYDDFEYTLSLPGDAGYQNRHALWQSLKDNNFDVPDNYDDFRETLFNSKETKQQPTVKAKNGYIYSAAGLDSLEQGYKPEYVESKTDAQPQPTEPIDLSRPQEYEIPKPFAQYQQEMQQQATDPRLSQQWAQQQAEAQEQIVNPTKPFGERIDDIQRANMAEAARQQNRQQFDQSNFEPFFENHVAGVFGEERQAGEQRAQEEIANIPQDKGGGLLSKAIHAVKSDIATERHTDPEKIANATLQRVQDDDAFGDYVLSRMGINGQSGNDDGDSPQLSEREKEYMKQLFAKETGEVTNQIINRIYDNYKREGAPQSTLDYIAGKAFHENMVASLYDAMVRRVAGSSGMRQQLRAMAYQEYGDQAGWLTQVAGGAAPFAVDMLAGGFALPNAVGQAVVKGGMRLAAKEVAKEMEKRAVARGLEGAALKEAVNGASGIAERYIATNAPIVNIALRTAGGAANFATYDAQSELIRQISDGEFRPFDLMKEAAHGALLGGAMGVTGGLIGRATQGGTLAQKVAGDVAAVASETGIFAAANGIQKAIDQGIDITDVDWADTTGEALGMVVGMKATGAVMHPKQLLNRYRNSKDLGLQLNQHDIDELKSHGYDFDGIFKGLGKFGEIAPQEPQTVKRSATEYTPNPDGTGRKRNTTVEEITVDTEAYDKIMSNPELSSSVKRKLAYIVTGKVLNLEPTFGATLDIDDNGKATITTLNAYGNVIDTKEYDSADEARKDYQALQEVARTNTIGGLERIADKAGFPDVLDEAKGRTKEETGVDVDDIEQLSSVSEEKANEVLDTYQKNLQEAYMQRFNGKMKQIDAMGKAKADEEANEPIQRTERRQAAYDRGATVAEDESLVPQLIYESKLAEARIMQMMPDGEQSGTIRSQVMQAMQSGDVEGAEAILQRNAPYLTPQQREAMEQWMDTFETDNGVTDAVNNMIAQYEEEQRDELAAISDEQGNITKLQLKDGSIAYYKSGDMNRPMSNVFVTTEDGRTIQISSNDIVSAEPTVSAEDMLADNVQQYDQWIKSHYSELATGQWVNDGQEADISMGGQIFHVVKLGYDEAGNNIFQMPDGSRMAMSIEQTAEAIAAADDIKIQQQLAQEMQEENQRKQAERFGKGIVGYNEGTPDLIAKDTKPEVAAEYLLSQTDEQGQPIDRKVVLDGIHKNVDDLNIAKQQALQALQTANNNLVMADEGEVDALRQQAEQLEAQVADLNAQYRKWGEIRQAMMNDEERQAYEKDRIKAINKAREQSQKDVQPSDEAVTIPTVKELMEQYAERSDAEAFVEQQRKQLSKLYQQDLYPQYDDIQKQLEEYRHGLTDLTPEEIKALTDQQAMLSGEISRAVEAANQWKQLVPQLSRSYAARESQNMTSHERAMNALAKETNRQKKVELAKKAFADDPMALNVLDNMEPQDVNEWIAANLGAGSINWEGLQRGEHYLRGLRDEMGKDKTRGIGAGYDTNAFNTFLAPEGQGKGIEEVVHDIAESSPYDTQEVKNALLSMLQQATKPTDISHYIENNRIAQAEDIYEKNLEHERELEEEAKRQAEDDAIREMTGMEPEEYDAFMADLEQRLAEQEGYQNSEEYFKQIEEYDRRNEGNAGGSQAESPVVVQGQEVKQAGAEAEGQGGAGKDAELTSQELGKLTGEYNSAPMALITSSMSERSQAENIFSKELVDGKSDEEIHTVIVNILKSAKDGVAVYVPELEKIIIFADRVKPERIKEIFFHENTHAFLHNIYQDGVREVAELFWELTPESFGSTTKDFVERKYDEVERKEEFFAYCLGRALANGDIKSVLNIFSDGREKENIEGRGSLAESPEGRAEGASELHSSRRAGREVVETLLSKLGYDKARDKNNDPFPARLAKAKADTNVNPTEDQKKAGNYKMGHISFGGYKMSIENPKGSVRSGVDANGKPWSIEMQDTYGYIREKYGTDKDHLDFFINDDADLDNWNGRVYVVDQKNEDGTFDEHKVMYGYPTFAAAKKAYLRNYEDGWWEKHVMSMTGVRKEKFDKWLESSDYKTKPFAEYSVVKDSDPVSSNVDQLMADIEDRKKVPGVAEEEPKLTVKGVLNEVDLKSKKPDDLKQLRKKENQDRAMAKMILGTTDAIKGTDKERTLQENIIRAEANMATIDKVLAEKQAEAKKRYEQQEIGFAMVDQLENMGFEVSTDTKENRRVLKQAEKDNSEAGKLHHYRTSDGKIYGFSYKGKIYLDPTKIDAELPMHEYGHPWCEAFRKLNPEGWKNIVGLVKADKDTWEFIKSLNPDLESEDDIAEEMITKCSGERGAEYARKEFERMNGKGNWGNIWKNISKAIQDFWKAVGDFLHIKYESAEQVYDQVIRDFANKVNPRKRVEDWLKERDESYMDAVAMGDNEQAAAIFDEALREHIGNGITPFIAVDAYKPLRKLAHEVKTRDPKVIAKAADLMAPLIPKDAVLVPAPSHTGKATDMLDLANAISERTGAPVADVLTSGERGSQYEAKYAGKPIASSEMGITLTGELPEGLIPVVIDNVVDTGNTAEACVQALGKGIVASLADSAESYKHVASLKSAEPIVTDRNGNVVPLSKRFELKGKYLERAGKPEKIEAETQQTEQPTADTVLKEVERRKEVVNDQKEAENAVKQYLSRKPKNEEEQVKQRATKAVLKAMEKAGVPYKVVSKEEEKQMLQIFSMMNQEPIKELARKLRNSVGDPHGKSAKYIIYNMADPFGVPMYFEKLSTAKYALKGLKQMAPEATWQILDIGYPDEAVEEPGVARKAADMNVGDLQADIEVWHGSGNVFTKFDHSHMGEGAGSQVFGWGTYLSDSQSIGGSYADISSRGWTYGGKNRTQLYTEATNKDLEEGRYNTDGEIVAEILGNLDAGYSIDKSIANVRKFTESAIRDHEENLAELSEAEKKDLEGYRKELEFINSLHPEDFEPATKMLYKVDIPEDTGSNYIDWENPIDQLTVKRVKDAALSLGIESQKKYLEQVGYPEVDPQIEEDLSPIFGPSPKPDPERIAREIIDEYLGQLDGKSIRGKDLYNGLSHLFISDRDASKFLYDLGYVGIKYPAGTIYGGCNGATNYVIFNEDDAKIVQSISFMWGDEPAELQKKKSKKLLGWSDGKQVYLTKDGLNPNTPLHETTHLWDNWCMKEYPDLWKKLVEAMKQTAMWEEISKNPNYRNIWNDENRMASEVHARLSGAAGEDEFMKAAFKKDTPQSIINQVKSALKKFWDAVLRLFGKHSKTVGSDWDDLRAIIRMPIRDLVNQDFEKVMKVAEPYADAEGAVAQAMKDEIIERTLMGVHNITEDKLRKVIKAGGLANPSLAVIDTKGGYVHTDYGAISLIPKASLIDAKTGRNAGTFTADAWTPSYPPVERVMSNKGWDKFFADLKDIRKVDSEVASKLRVYMESYLDNREPDAMYWWYLHDRGLNPEIAKHTSPYNKELSDRISELTGGSERATVSDLSEDAVKEIATLYHDYKKSKGEELRPLEERIADTKQRINPDDPNKMRQLRLQGIVNDLEKYGEIKSNLDNFISSVNFATQRQGETDDYTTFLNARKTVENKDRKADYQAWLEELNKRYGIEEKIFDGWTPSGNKKYIPNTLENVSKYMKKQGLNGATNWSSIGNWIAKVANKEKTLEGIRSKRRNLGTPETEHDAFHEKWSNIMHDIADKLGNGDMWTGEQRMSDILEHKDFAGYTKREYGITLSKEDIEAINTFIKEVRNNFPTGYFETKFERPVKLNEFAIAVVPEGTSEDVIKALKDSGLDVRTFDNSGTEEARKENRRQAVMNAVTPRKDILFHIEDDPETVKKLDEEPKVVGYRNVVVNEDGTLGSPMANRLGKKGEERKATTPFEYGKWERSDEHPELANENGKIDLIKPDGKSVGGVDYNPYIHIRPNKVNKQFKQAWERPNLIYVETEYPTSELNGEYHAEKAALPTGKHPWGGGELILSRWDKPLRMVPWEEVADDWVKEFKGTEGIHFDIIPPKLLPILAERGMTILPPHKGMGKDCQEAYKEWKDKHDIMRSKGNKPLLAPNGKRSNLDKKNYYAVRTQNFKKYFGDWEKAARETTIVPGEADHGFKNFAEARKWAKENIVRTYNNEETGGKGDIFISGKAVDKFTSEEAVRKSENKDVHLSVLKVLPAVIKEGIDADAHPDYIKIDGKRQKENGINPGVTIHRVYGAVDIDGKVYRVKITLKEDRTQDIKTKAYSYEATKIELLDGQSATPVGVPRNSNNSITLAKLLKNVDKSYGNGEKIIDSSQVVDENGEPLVVYHNTNLNSFLNRENEGKPFHVFKAGRVGDTGFFKLAHFGTKEQAERRTAHLISQDDYRKELGLEPVNKVYQYAVFLNIRNPKRVKDFGGNEEAWMDAAIKAQEEGYDGLVYENKHEGKGDSWAVFSPEQIKSATENDGTYDPTNPDIRRSSGGAYNEPDKARLTEAAEAAGEALGGVKVNTVTYEDADAKMKREIENGTKGIYDPNTHTVTLLLDNIEDANDAVRTVFHEKLGHEGLVALLGSQEAVNKFGSFVFHSAKNDVRKRIMDKAEEIDPEWRDGARYSKAAQEVLAEIAEEGRKTEDEFDLWTKVKHYLIRFLNKIGLRVRGLLNDKDLAYYIVKTGKALQRNISPDLSKQATEQDILRSRGGKPRQRRGESMAQYFQRLREWEKWKLARQTALDNGDPEPEESQFQERAEAKYREDMAEWRRENGLSEGASSEVGTFPIRRDGESPQEFAIRVQEYEARRDLLATAPQYTDYMRKANEDYRRAYTEWRERYDLEEQMSVDQRLYEGDVPVEPTFTDADEEVHAAAERDLADEAGFEIDERGAKRMAKLAVIERRKDFESANAEDAIWVYDFMKMTDSVADEIKQRTGQDVTGKEIREALPFLIEADRRRENMEAEKEEAVQAINMSRAIQQAHSFMDFRNLEQIGEEVNALQQAWEYQENHPSGDAQQAYREAAARLADKLNELNKDYAGYNKLFADDIMQIRSLLVHATVAGGGEVMPPSAQRFADMPEMKPLMEHIKAWYDEFFQLLEDTGLRGDAGYIEDGYVNHVWDKEKSDPKAWEQYIENRQRTKSPNMRHREIDTYMDGIKIGLVPKYTDIADMIAHYSRQNNEAVANRRFLDALKFVYVQEMNSEGEVTAVLPFIEFDKPNGFVRERYVSYYVPGVGDVYVLKEAKRPIETVLGPIRTPGVGNGLRFAGHLWDITGGIAKKMELALSGFHALALFEVDLAQNPIQAWKHLFKYIFFDSLINKTRPAYAHPEDFQLAAKHLVQLGATEDYAAADVNAITDSLKDYMLTLYNSSDGAKKMAALTGLKAAEVLDFFNKGFDKILWNYLHDGLKLCAFKELAKQIDRRVEKQGLDEKMREQLLDEAGQYVNDLFGGQFWDIINFTPSEVKWSRRALLSPDWTISSMVRLPGSVAGLGGLYTESGFMNYLKYWQRKFTGKKADEDFIRDFRMRNAIFCYVCASIIIGVLMMNLINSWRRFDDKKKQKKIADEIRKTNPEYKSPYELKYPNGMKWYDYTMYGNAAGHKTHLFTGRYNDGKEMYARWGKHFREVPELLMGEHGIEFPYPLLNRLWVKKNPNVSMVETAFGLQGLSGYEADYHYDELVQKYGKNIATLMGVARHFVPFGISLDPQKEWKPLDFFMPSSKGYSPWKAKRDFEYFIKLGDWDGIRETYNACVMNGVDVEEALVAAQSSIKATQREELSGGVVDLSTAAEKFDNATNPEQRRVLFNKLKKHLKESEYKALTLDEAKEKVKDFLESDNESDKENIRYLMLINSKDAIAEEKLKDLGRIANKYVKMMNDAPDEQVDSLEEIYGVWYDVKEIVDETKKDIREMKKLLGGMDDKQLIKDIRQTIHDAQKEIDELNAPK